MRNGFLGSVGTVLASAGLAWAQPQTPAAPTPPTAPAAKATATDSAAPAGPVVSGPGPVVAGPHGGHGVPMHGIPLVAGPEDMPPRPYERPYCGELDCERDFDFWAGGEYLRWRQRDLRLAIPLISTGPAGSFGILSDPASQVLLGNQDIRLGEQNGARFSAGVGIVPAGVGFESTGFIMEKANYSFTFASDPAGNPTLARPVIDSNSGLETSSLVASPGAFSGLVTVSGESRLWGAEVNMFKGKVCKDHIFGDWLIGFRYMDLDETLVIQQRSTLQEGGTAGFLGDIIGPGSVITIGDSFRTRNEFYGGQLGTQWELRVAGLFIYVMGKVAIGNTHQSIDAQGGSTATTPGTAGRTSPGGLLALASNSVHTSRDVFSFIPEGNVNVGYQFGKHVRVYAGYTFIYWDDVLRPGQQLDRTVNPTQIPTSLAFGPIVGTPAPPVVVKNTDYWIQGWNVGAVIRY
jgi:hypothetical protein